MDVISTSFEQLTDFYQSFPDFDKYVELFPDNLNLQFILQDLYEIYANFSMFTITYIVKKPLCKSVFGCFTLYVLKMKQV